MMRAVRLRLTGRLLALALAVWIGASVQAHSQVAEDSAAQWQTSLAACSSDNRAACDQAVSLAAELYDRTDRNVALTWMQVCMAGDLDRCEIGYRRFRSTSFPDDPKPISHMFARASCFGGIYDLCRPWDDFETTDPDKRAIVMADVCMQGGKPNTCYQALAHFRHKQGLYNTITYDLSKTLCERYMSGSACRVFAETLEARWDHRRAYRFHNHACQGGLEESCPDAVRLKKRVDYENRQAQARLEARLAREAAAARASNWRAQLSSSGYSSTGTVRTPATPFGSSTRDRQNWRRYERNLCLGNPVNTYC